MTLDFKGLISKEDLEKNIDQLDEIIKENEYAIVISGGVGKYVVFDLDFVINNLYITEHKARRIAADTLTLVESMIKALEDLPERKTTAKELALLVEPDYGKKASPVVIRARAEENANGKSDYDCFTIEPGNLIGLVDGVSFEIYLDNKLKRRIESRLYRLLEDKKKISLQDLMELLPLKISNGVPKITTTQDLSELILTFGGFDVVDGHVKIKKQ